MQAARAARARRAVHAALHPALRWTLGDGWAHRRTPFGRPACGAPASGEMLAALAGTRACPGCFAQLHGTG